MQKDDNSMGMSVFYTKSILQHPFLKRSALLFLFLLFTVILSAQPVDKITVKKVKWEVSIVADDSIFRLQKQNLVAINVKGGNNYAINVQGGSIAKKNNKYNVIPKEEGAVTITVYEKLPQNKMRVLCTKFFTVKKIPPAQLFVCGVRSDSVIDKQQIIADNVVTAYHPFYKVNLPVIGFDVVFQNKGKTDKLSSGNNHFTIGMRNRIYGLKSGTLLYFEKLYYLLPDGSTEKIDEFEVYISETNKYKVGYRVPGL